MRWGQRKNNKVVLEKNIEKVLLHELLNYRYRYLHLFFLLCFSHWGRLSFSIFLTSSHLTVPIVSIVPSSPHRQEKKGGGLGL